MRQLAASALLIGNAVFLFVGLSDLLFVVDGWASEFGTRSAATFDAFAGPVAIVLPLLAVLIATHVAPTVPQARGIVMAALGSYGFSGLFGVITYMGAFAGDLFSVRATFDGLLLRAVWLAFLTIAAMAVYKIFRAVDPPTSPKAGYAYGPTVYGRPYPGQPMYPQPTYKPGTAEPKYEQHTANRRRLTVRPPSRAGRSYHHRQAARPQWSPIKRYGWRLRRRRRATRRG
jgi:hypothetical protein